MDSIPLKILEDKKSMKKGLFALLAIFTIFAMTMVSCETDSGGAVSNITIQFDLNGGSGEKADITIKSGGSLSFTQISGAGITSPAVNKEFGGWTTVKDDDTTKVNANTKFTANPTVLYAFWSITGPGTIVITFDYGAGFGDLEDRTIEIGEAIGTLPTPTTPPDGYTFDKWVRANGVTPVTAETPFTAAETIKAKYNKIPNTSESDSDDFISSDTNIEIMYLENAAVAAYQFTLPEGNTFGQYEYISVDYMVDSEFFTKPLRHTRLYGALDPIDFLQDKNGAVYAPWNTYNTANGILADKGVTNGDTAWQGKLGATDADTWFTVTYKLDGSTKNGSYNMKYMPAEDAGGTFYFGLGLPGAGDSKGTPGLDLTKGFVSKVKNVRMLPYGDEDADEIFGVVPVKIPRIDDDPLIIADGQFFGSYCDPIVFSWRSQDPDDTPHVAVDPDYVAPDPQGPEAEEDFVFLALTDTPIKNTVPRASATGDDLDMFKIPITFPTGYNLSSYATITVRAKFYDASNTDITESTIAAGTNPAGWGLGSLKFKDDLSANPHLAVIWNLNKQTIDAPIPQTAKDRQLTFEGLHIEGNDDAVQYIEITEIIFQIPVVATEDLVIDDPVFKGDWGSTGESNSFPFANTSRILYAFPAAYIAYDNVIINITLTKTAGDEGVLKLAIKNSTGALGNTANLTGGANTWPNTVEGDNVLKYPLSAFDRGGVCFEFNNDHSDEYTLTINSITFTNSPIADKVVTAPVFKGDWGSTGEGNSFPFANQSRILYAFPAGYDAYDNVIFSITLTKTAGDEGALKLAIKNSTGAFGNTANLTGGANTWPNTVEGANTLKYSLAAFDRGGVCFEFNNDHSDEYTLVIDKITFTNDEI